MSAQQEATTADAPAMRLLRTLDGVRQREPGKWVARCPAHEDQGPSLAVTELSDGRVLLHCFSGCSAHGVVRAVGLELSDLYPAASLDHARKTTRQAFSASQRLAIVAHEATVVVLIAERWAKGDVSDTDKDRLWQAARRIAEATR